MGLVVVAVVRGPAAPPIFFRRPTLASKASRPPRRRNGSLSRKPQPSMVEVQRAIGITEDPVFSNSGQSPSSSPSSSSSSSPFLDFLSSTPIGQPESKVETKLREAAEWMVKRTEDQEMSGQRILLVVCLNILPVWVLMLLVASGVVKLPFDLKFLNDLVA